MTTAPSAHDSPKGSRRRCTRRDGIVRRSREPAEASGIQRRKLIEVVLPLDAINRAAAREKSIRHGHPSALHLWWARRPMAVARAVLFAQLVDDPSEYVDTMLPEPETTRATRRPANSPVSRNGKPPSGGEDAGVASGPPGDPTATAPGQVARRDSREMAVEQERERLFELLEELVLWENARNEEVLERARTEIRRSWGRACAENADHPCAGQLFDPHKLPEFHDPFAGGGTLPLEAQRLGLDANAGDLNPVAVLVSKAMVEIPPRFAGRPAVHPAIRDEQSVATRTWRGAQGLAEDARYYGRWMRDEAERRIGQLYPGVEITPEMIRERPDLEPHQGRKLEVVAWIWARTVKSPNPTFADAYVPLASTFMLSNKRGKEAYVEPEAEGHGYRFTVKAGKPPDAGAAKAGTKLSREGFRCLVSGDPIGYGYIEDEADAGRMKERLMAVVATWEGKRIYLSPTSEAEAVARSARPSWKPDIPSCRTGSDHLEGRRYGLRTFGDYFTARQLVALNTFSDLVTEAIERVRRDAVRAGLSGDDRPLRDGGKGAAAYAEAVGVYLGFALSRLADRGSALCTWVAARVSIRHTFARQAFPMTWDYAEFNPLPSDTGGFAGAVRWIADSIDGATAGHGLSSGSGEMADAARQTASTNRIVSTDPPWYGNVGYADLSDFFYVWLRRALKPVFPTLFDAPATPKAEELVALPYRHGGKEEAEAFFLDGMTQAMRRLSEQSHPGFPVTLYYAFKPPGRKGEAEAGSSAGWEAIVDSVIRSGLAIVGTWPIRTEAGSRTFRMGGSAPASGIVLVCRRRPPVAPPATHGEFLAALGAVLPHALRVLQSSHLPPADLAQAAIGSGLSVYTRYAQVVDTGGQPLPVGEALTFINRALGEALVAQDGILDAESRWAIAWFEQHGFEVGDHGAAETLSQAAGTSVTGMVEAGILRLRADEVRLLRPEELPSWWDPAGTDERPLAWKALHHLIRRLALGGEIAAAVLAAKLAHPERARDLCYRLFALCERGQHYPESLAYNDLVRSWPEIRRLASKALAKRAGSLAGDADGAS